MTALGDYLFGYLQQLIPLLLVALAVALAILITCEVVRSCWSLGMLRGGRPIDWRSHRAPKFCTRCGVEIYRGARSR